MPNVLIVGNRADDRAVVRSLFEAQDEFVVCGEAENGVEAVEKATELSPDLIILNVSATLVDGFEVAEIFKQTMPHVPLFLLTSHYNVVTERIALSCGICAVFAKDDDPHSLILNARAVCGDAHEEQ